jgi:hypothetical protein
MTIRTGPASARGLSPQPAVAAPPATVRRLPLDRGPIDRSTGQRAPDDGRGLERLGVVATPVPDEDEGPGEREPTEAFDPYEAERAWRG